MLMWLHKVNLHQGISHVHYNELVLACSINCVDPILCPIFIMIWYLLSLILRRTPTSLTCFHGGNFGHKANYLLFVHAVNVELLDVFIRISWTFCAGYLIVLQALPTTLWSQTLHQPPLHEKPMHFRWTTLIQATSKDKHSLLTLVQFRMVGVS